MKFLSSLILAAVLTGCATTGAVVPALEGKPRVSINKQVPPETAPPNHQEE